MAFGKVKWFSADKGYGFIEPEEGGKDVFVHVTAVERSKMPTLKQGQRVSFDVEQNKRTGKSQATNLAAA